MNKHHQKLAVFFLIGSLSFIFALAWNYQQEQQKKSHDAEVKLDLERKETSQRIRESGRLLAEQMKKNPVIVPIDPMLPPEQTDADELAQAKLWHHTPANQRHKLLQDAQ